MEINFENEEIREFILNGRADSRPYSKWRSNRQLRQDLDKAMRILSVVDNCSELQSYKALNYEQLKYDRSGQSSIRLGFKTKFRLIFTELSNGIVINIMKLFRLIYEYINYQDIIKGKILFIKLPPSLRHLRLHSSVTMPASLPLHEAESARKADEILIKK